MQRDHAAGKQLFGVAHYAPISCFKDRLEQRRGSDLPLCYGISCLEPHQEFGNDVHVALLWKGYDTRQMYSINLVTAIGADVRCRVPSRAKDKTNWQ